MNITDNLTIMERAISELRRGGKIVITDSNENISVLLVAAEMINKNTINDFINVTSSRPNIILSSNRSKAIGLENKAKPTSILIEENWNVEDILSICMPIKHHAIPNLNGVLFEKKDHVYSMCLLMLRQSHLLPAGLASIISNLSVEDTSAWCKRNNFILIEKEFIENFEENKSKSLTIEVRAKVPIAETDDCEIVIFRPKEGGNEHFCLLIGEARNLSEKTTLGQVPIVRVHSQCITGDVLESLKCDCGQQLKQSIKTMVKNNNGILIYLAQEGRDIGLLNKLRAYSLQEEGIDTVDANITLGFEDDERLYYPVKEILRQLNVKSIKLITNNPKKIDHLAKMGIKVVDRLPIIITPNKHNKNYLKTKSIKSGHIL